MCQPEMTLQVPVAASNTVPAAQLTLASLWPVQAAVAAKFQIESQVLDSTLRIQTADAHRLISGLVDAFGDAIERVSLSHPSLEDVYIQKTGHQFWAEKG